MKCYCPQCAMPLTVPDEGAGPTLSCPICAHEFPAPPRTRQAAPAPVTRRQPVSVVRMSAGCLGLALIAVGAVAGGATAFLGDKFPPRERFWMQVGGGCLSVALVGVGYLITHAADKRR